MLIAGDSLEIKRGYNREKCTSSDLGDNRGKKNPNQTHVGDQMFYHGKRFTLDGARHL